MGQRCVAGGTPCDAKQSSEDVQGSMTPRKDHSDLPLSPSSLAGKPKRPSLRTNASLAVNAVSSRGGEQELSDKELLSESDADLPERQSTNSGLRDSSVKRALHFAARSESDLGDTESVIEERDAAREAVFNDSEQEDMSNFGGDSDAESCMSSTPSSASSGRRSGKNLKRSKSILDSMTVRSQATQLTIENHSRIRDVYDMKGKANLFGGVLGTLKKAVGKATGAVRAVKTIPKTQQEKTQVLKKTDFHHENTRSSKHSDPARDLRRFEKLVSCCGCLSRHKFTCEDSYTEFYHLRGAGSVADASGSASSQLHARIAHLPPRLITKVHALYKQEANRHNDDCEDRSASIPMPF
jgi:hypothetical protein